MYDESPPEDQPGPSSTSVSRSSSTTEPPKKGILKRPSLRAQIESRDTVFPLPGHRPSPDRFPDKPGTRIPKLSVTWWEKNAVAIFGDTSDENNTDSEQVLRDLGSGPRQQGIRQTAILDSEEDSEDVRPTTSEAAETAIEDEQEPGLEDDVGDDAVSVGSTGSASSSVVGRWWTGKDTRFVPHCQKRGCNHKNHELGEYLTPTQRRNKEMSELKKELRSALGERDEKDRHLIELRERIQEIDLLNNVQMTLSDGHKQMQMERESRETLEREKKAIEKKHAVRVNQLVQETLQARDEITRLTARIRELEEILSRPRAEVSTMTEPIQYAAPVIYAPPAPLSPTAPTDPSSFSHVRSPPLSPVEVNPMSPVHSLPDHFQSMSFHSPFPLPSPMSISVDSKLGGGGNPLYFSQEALNHMQACQNEAFIWRTKAAQLEIVVKDQLLKANNHENTIRELEQARREMEELRRITGMPPTPQAPDTTVMGGISSVGGIAAIPGMLDSGIDNTSTTSSPQHRIGDKPSDCSNPACTERKKNLIDENNQLLETIEDVNTRIRELEDDVSSIRNDYDALEEQRDRLKEKLADASREVDGKVAEIAAGNIVITRIQGEKDTMQKAITYMEERMQVYQNTLMEHDLIVSDETAGNWRKGFNDPRYSVMVSKRVQTELTSEALNKHDDEFQSTKRKLQALHSEFTANRTDLHGRFEEIEKILLTKTQLVEMLTKQLEDTRRDQRSELDIHQTEREQYKRSLNEIALVAERVPGLESNIEQLLQDKSDFELRFKQQQEEYENGLEAALEESLKKYKEQSEYWKEKMSVVEQQLERSKNETVQLLREREESRLKWKLEKAEMEQRLTSSIDHVALLNSQMNKSRRDVECEARPRHVSKYVACRPNAKSKSTNIEKGDLFDESDERLKLCQGELATTRRQVHVLQQKLISTIQERPDRRVQVRRRIGCVVERPSTSADGRKEKTEEEEPEKMDALHSRNAQLREKLSQVEEEKASIVRNERERIQHLASEFDNVRKELDQEMCRYESEKKWLKSRIRNLEKDNEELQRQLDKSSSPSAPDAARVGAAVAIPRIAIDEDRNSCIRKTLSEPELGYDDEETSKLRAENVRLISELDRVRDSIRRTASGASAASRATARSQLSPAFANLADDLNMVKSDLEQILSSMEDEEPLRHVERVTGKVGVASSRSPSARRTPLEEEALQSEILDKVMADWEEDEKDNLARDLKRSRQERDNMKNRLDRVAKELGSARAELEVYRREPRDADVEGNDGRLRKSRSTVDLVGENDKDEATRWKLKCGTMFRELNSMRSGYAAANEERRDLRIQLAMMRGELELAKCQQKGDPMTSSAYCSPRSMRSEATSRSYHSALDTRRSSRDEVIVHESPTAFKRGSTRESVVCSIITPAQAVSRETRERTRSRSGQRRKSQTNKDDFEAMEQRRRGRKSLSHYATAPQSVSSSMTSLANVPAPSEQPQILHKPPLPQSMSQSWHEPSTSGRQPADRDDVIHRSIEEIDRAAMETAAAGGDSRSTNRVVSLREKVGRLNRENKNLQEEIEKWKKRTSSAEVQAGYRSGIDVDRLNRLEEEKETLARQVRELLETIQQDAARPAPPSPTSSNLYLEEQLTLSRQENDMYERKIRELEEERREMYLVMFKKGQQAATMDLKEDKSVDQMTQDRVVLKFLHDAFYYFLMNKGDSKEHLQVIMTMLDFSPDQKDDVTKKRGKSH